MKKYKVGLVIGRFQPFHKGHLYLFKKALERANKLIIAIGSSNISNEENPLSYKTRVVMLKKVLSEQGWEDKVRKIVPSIDHLSDNIWLEKLLYQTGRLDVEIGNNNWTNDIFENAGFEVVRIPYFKRDLYEGTKIRRLIKSGGYWQARVPGYLVKTIKETLAYP